ncbi:hypothetical protein, partial [Immundisolibacter sp.]|uniref:hypothetical protein n=1 Tax=Immundisolibacter sp. TaxID=1934948 RepID=UPI003563A1E4
MNCKIALAAGLMTLGLTSFSANASHIGGFTLFDGLKFTFDGSAYSNTVVLPSITEFEAEAIDFSYQADIDQTNTSPFSASFVENGVAFFSAFQNPLGSPVDASTTGLGLGALGYRMYAVFDGAGTVVPGAGGTAIDGTFTSFNIKIYIDADANSAIVGAGVGAPNGTTSVSNTGDDVLILTGVLTIGGFHVSTGLLGGDFDVLFDVVSYDPSVWGGAAFAGDLNGDGDFDDEGEFRTFGDVNGVNTGINGL